MRIKSLEISGFKSFVDRTVLDFRPGITCVVGPNGCGKSNVVDAVRWAMGEQSPRRLRGKGMEDVIFAGAEGRAPVGMAEVVLTFDNSDGTAPASLAAFTEIQIARRLYRSGESEYRMNKVPCRLRDIHDFFRDTGIGTKGYTIVEQGQIGAIISAKPEDRRVLIEEAAGISKYKARRQEAERKIASTEQNMVRVSDVLGEIRRQINSIERQAKKAARYKRLREFMRGLDLSVASDQRKDILEEVAGAQRRFDELQDEAAALELELSERELALEQHRLQLAEREKVLNAGSESLYNLRTEIKQLESQIEFEERERETLAESNTSRRGELTQLHQQLQAAEEEHEQVRSSLESVESQLASQAERTAAAEAEAAAAAEQLREIQAERETANQALVEILTAAARAEDRAATLEDRRAEVATRLRTTDEMLEVQQSEASRVSSEQDNLERGLQNLLAERDRLMGSLREGLERHRASQQEAVVATETARTARERWEARRARLQSLVELLERNEDVGEGNRFLLNRDSADSSAGLRGLVRDVLEVAPEFEPAVEAVLSDRAEALVVDRAEGALGALAALREADAGRGVFVAPIERDEMTLGFVPLGSPLLERVRVREGFEEIAHSLLSGVNLVDDLAEAVQIYGHGKIPATFVTRAGDVLSRDGVIRGGGPASGMLSRRRETRELETEVQELESQVRSTETAAIAGQTRMERAADEVENLRNRHHTAVLAVANHEKDLERARERVKSIGDVREERTAERSVLVGETETMDRDRQQIAEALEAGKQRKAELQRELDALGLKIGSADREWGRLEKIVTEQRIEHAARAQRRDALLETRARAETSVRETQQWIERRNQEIANAEARTQQLLRSSEEAESALAQKLRDEEAARQTNEEKRDSYERQAAEVRELEDAVRDRRSKASSRREESGRCELTVREAELRLEHLDTSIRDRWSVDLAQWEPPIEDPEDAAAAPSEAEAVPAVVGADGESEIVVIVGEENEEEEGGAAATVRDRRTLLELIALPREERVARLEDFRKKLDALGEVNLGAIEEHEELSERFRFLSEQKEDLETTLASLREAINRINRTSRKRFRETFEAVNERFQSNFPRLFRGGKASLSLTEADDILEAGVEIMAMPPGKRLQNVNLLSGGEKTLTALSLLIALFQVRPSPFFLLDEVDAPLDDANVSRFNEIVREMSEQSQFVLITHNKRTIECGDVLYGVTMESKGVSRMVSVELNDSGDERAA